MNFAQLSDSTHNWAPYTLQLTDRLFLRLYEDCSPCCLETAALQKGLVLMLDGKELIEEGIGFGVPVVKYEDKTFFSGNAKVYTRQTSHGYNITKVYTLDTVSFKKFGKATYIDDGVYSLLRKNFEKLYLKHKTITPLFNKLMELRQIAKIKTEFVKVKPRGTITITYRCKPNAINVQADFSKLALTKCREILLLNEQGSSTFQKYIDTDGVKLSGRKIGAWQTVTAQRASLQSATGRLSFGVQNRGVGKLFRGWEQTRKRFSWAGLSYSMPPNNGVLDYTIEVYLKS